MTDSQAFEDILQIWEFASNWLEIQKSFKLEELYWGLQYSEDTEEITLLTEIVWAILAMTVKEIPDEEREGEEPLLWMIKQLSDDKIRFVWPWLVSIIVRTELFEIIADKETTEIAMKLDSATPKTFNCILKYEEKIKILLYLCNSWHDLNTFREYISTRLKEKNKYSREKQETYNEIRQQEQEKRKRMEQHAKSDFVLNDGVKNEIVVLEEELKNATRTQGKVIRDKLSSLNKDKEKFRQSIQKIEEKISTLDDKIQKLNDQIWKVSLKVSIIGRDLENEYWYFKDDLSKVYIKNFKSNTWRCYNDEESIIELEESLITKGTRERKLYENLRKLKGKLRLRKRKDIKSDEKLKIEETKGEDGSKEPAKEENKDVEMADESQDIQKPVIEKQTIENKNDMLENDVDMETDTEHIDFDKNLERAIQYSLKKSEIHTRRSGRNRSVKLDMLSLNCIIEKLIENEEEYTEAAAELNKVWAPYSLSESIKTLLLQAKTEEEICRVLISLEEGYSHPMNFKPIDSAKLDQKQLETDNQSNASSAQLIVMNNKIIEDKTIFYRNNRKIKKFWSSDALKGKFSTFPTLLFKT